MRNANIAMQTVGWDIKAITMNAISGAAVYTKSDKPGAAIHVDMQQNDIIFAIEGPDFVLDATRATFKI